MQTDHVVEFGADLYLAYHIMGAAVAGDGGIEPLLGLVGNTKAQITIL